METKADILYSHGFFSEALLFYDVSIKKNPDNYYVKKRIFDIKFSILDIYDNSESQVLFHEYKFLLGIPFEPDLTGIIAVSFSLRIIFLKDCYLSTS